MSRVLGILGALDPWRQSQFIHQVLDDKQTSSHGSATQKDVQQLTTIQQNIGSEEYNQVALEFPTGGSNIFFEFYFRNW